MVLYANTSYSQDESGLKSSTFDGIQAGAYNPAALVGAIPKWQVNIMTLHTNIGNDYLYFKKLKGITSNFSEEEYIGENLNGKSKTINAKIDVGLPSFYFTIKEKNVIGISTNVHANTTIKDIEEDLVVNLYKNRDTLTNFLNNIQDERITGAANAYGSIDLTYSKELFGKYNHKLAIGGTLSLLSPIFFASFEGNNINYSIRENGLNTEASLNNSSFNLNVSDMFIDENSNYKFRISGVAFNAGVEYLNRKNCNAPYYKFRAGAVLRNWGFLKYNHSSQSRSFQADGSYVNEDDLTDEDGTFSNFDTFMDSLGTYNIPVGKFSVTTPASLNFYGDFRIVKDLYIFGSVDLNPYSFKRGIAKATVFNEVQAILRYENRIFGVYLPVGYNKYNGITSGAAFRIGFVSFGSKNMFSQFIRKQFNGLDFSLNFGFGDMRKVSYVNKATAEEK
jgi:hypothetical protein